MLDRADAILKLAAAAALLILAVGIGYYYAIFLPAQAEQTAKSAAENEKTKQDLQNKISVQKDAESKAASSEYDTCMTTTQENYLNRWNGNCQMQHQQQIDARTNCVTQFGPAQCSAYSVQPAFSCQLPKFTAESYDSDLRNEKQICLEKMKASQH